MFLSSLTSCFGSCCNRWWSRSRAQMRTRSDSCHSAGPKDIETRIPKGTRDSPEQSPQGTNESAPKLQDGSHVRTLDPGTVEKMVKYLVPAQRRRDPFFVPAFLFTYKRFTSTQQVLDLLFRRYEFFRPNCEKDKQNKSALSSLLETWLMQYPQDFCQGADLACLKQLLAYALVNLPDSEIIPEVCRLLTQRETH